MNHKYIKIVIFVFQPLWIVEYDITIIFILNDNILL